MPRFLLLLYMCALLACDEHGTSDRAQTSPGGRAPMPHETFAGWTTNGGSPLMSRYSSLTQIDTGNVHQLTPAWTYHTGDADTAAHSQIQCTPIVIGDTLYGVTAGMKLFALNAATGTHYWTFDPARDLPHSDNQRMQHIMINSRGITYWADENGRDARIFFTAGSHTYAVDARTGVVVPDFGTNGSIDLHKGLDREVDDLFVVSTSPGMVYRDLLIMGCRVDEAPPAAPGHIRAFDVRTGERRWIFHTLPRPGEPGFETWEDSTAWRTTGGANSWSGFALDEERGLLFVPTGSASYDFYGGKRLGSNLYANCLLALDAATGKLRWHHQLVHHDLWDKDLPSPPALVQIRQPDGRLIDAAAQTTKNGQLFVFERESGTPVFDIEERPVPTDGLLPGEVAHPTQPEPVLPVPFSRRRFGPEDINPYLSAEDRDSVRRMMSRARYEGPYTPPGPEPVLVFPGFDGGGEWGGPAFDPGSNLLFVNSNEMPRWLEMVDNPVTSPIADNERAAGEWLYGKHCQTCHGQDRAGTGNNPSLLGVADAYDEMSLAQLVRHGRRMMPAFGHLEKAEIAAIATYLLELEERYHIPYLTDAGQVTDDPHHVPYKLKGYTKFLAPDGRSPAIGPPWGQLTAIDLATGEHVWQIPLGDHPDFPADDEGTENYGGPAATAGGLVFIAATMDGMFRAFDQRTGRVLWQTELPAAGFATPSVYEASGRQFVVIACGGGKLGTRSGDAYVAFALPLGK